MKISTKAIVTAAVLIALMFVLALLPFVFLLPLLFACCTQGRKMSLFMGLSFGIISVIYSLTASSPIAVAFINAPWIAILPRIAIGFTAHGAYTLSKRLINGNGKVALASPYVIGAAVGTLTNTALVVTCLVLFQPSAAFEGMTVLVLVPFMLTSGLIELAVAVVVVPPLCIAVNKALRIHGQNANKVNQTHAQKEENALNKTLASETAIVEEV